MKVIAGDEVGLIKQINIRQNYEKEITPESKWKTEIVVWGNVDRKQEIEKMSFYDSCEQRIGWIRGSGIVEFVDIETGHVRQSIKGVGIESDASVPQTGVAHQLKPVGFHCEKERFCIGFDNGRVYYYEGVLEGEELLWTDLLQHPHMNCLDTKGSLQVMKLCSQLPSIIATGGKENDLQVWDIRKSLENCAFKAKNLKNDEVDLRQPVWIMDLIFLSDDGRLVAVATAYNQIRLYDTKIQRRPILQVKVGEHPLKSLVTDSKYTRIFISDTFGEIYLFKLEDSKSLIGKLKGAAGTVTTMCCHPTLPLIATSGLDRHLRIYNYETRSLFCKIYLKQRTNSLLFSKDEECFRDILSKKRSEPETNPDLEVPDISYDQDTKIELVANKHLSKKIRPKMNK